MSNVIQVLAQMGSDATLQSNDAITSLLLDSELDTALIEAIQNSDIIALERQLDVRHNIVCAIGIPDGDEDEKDDDKDDDDDSTEETSNIAIGF